MDCAFIINIGNIPYTRITIPKINDYCYKYNINLTEINENINNYKYPHWCKLDVLKQFLDSNYKRCLYIDVDIIIKNDPPNIFDSYEGGLGIVTDLEHNNHYWTDHKCYNYLKNYYNSKNFEINTLMRLDSYEQPYLNFWIDQLDLKVQRLCNVWNICSKFMDMRRFYFIHYSTADEKKKNS